MVLFCREISLSIEMVFEEFSNIKLLFVPLVDPIPTFLPINKIPLIERYRTIYLPCLPLRHIVHPMPLIKMFRSSQLPITVSFVMFDSTLVENRFILDEKSILAISYPAFETAFIDRTVIVDQSAGTVRKTIFPFPLIIGTVVKQIVQRQFKPLPFGSVMRPYLKKMYL